MLNKRPKISILIWTYNRADLVERSIKSVLNQTYSDFELVLINNGSQDNTKEVLKKYEGHEKIRVLHLEKNRGDLGGMNYALDQIQGEWFTTLGDDDEIVENAFELLLEPTKRDPEINAVTGNSIDTSTKSFAGFGLEKDQYVPIELMVGKVSGEFFGITKTELLGDIRIREDLPGEDNVFWHQIDTKAKRYYIHKALKVWYTDHGSTESSRINSGDSKFRAQLYKKLLEERFYWELLRKYNNRQYMARCLRGLLFLTMNGYKEGARQYSQMLLKANLNWKYRLLSGITKILPSGIINQLYLLASNNSYLRGISGLLFKKYSKIN